MGGHAHDGGTPGWKAMRGTCPVCKRDTALSPPRPPYVSTWRIKRHKSSVPGQRRADGVCRGVGQAVPDGSIRFPEK